VLSADGPLAGLSEQERTRLRPGGAEFVAPMLATLTDRYFSDDGWVYECKLDGVRRCWAGLCARWTLT
jgi:ATP-dependent DNA ligase